ncbi:hypothetical protein ElyMa_001360700 [Elysia marginata]|uniref:Uncharacterized protein n=1 Tax=Elysia marginata TaxID=1093978 RepID=A0AAV4IN66_9GAST|nr:hypothetical protein ElyMa_001360700 [Elysia marginata]
MKTPGSCYGLVSITTVSVIDAQGQFTAQCLGVSGGSGCAPRQVLRTRIQTASWMGKLHEKKGVAASWLRAGPGDENIKQSQIFLLWPPASPAGAKKL